MCAAVPSHQLRGALESASSLPLGDDGVAVIAS